MTEPAVTATDPAPDTLPDPSLPVSGLEPFVHTPTGLTALRPSNWQFDSAASGFTSTSSRGAPDGFVGLFVSREAAETYAASLHVSAACACRVVSWVLLDGLKNNVVDGPPPETLEQVMNEDGSGTLVVATTTVTPTSRIPVRLIQYARTTITPDGLIFAYAGVPADQFAAEEELLRQMVDSVAFPDGSTVSTRPGSASWPA